MGKILVGISSGVSKEKQNPYYCVTVLSPCDETDNKYGMYGQKADRIFVPEKCFQQIKPEDLGKEVVFDYDVRGNRASVVGLKIVK